MGNLKGEIEKGILNRVFLLEIYKRISKWGFYRVF